MPPSPEGLLRSAFRNALEHRHLFVEANDSILLVVHPHLRELRANHDDTLVLSSPTGSRQRPQELADRRRGVVMLVAQCVAEGDHILRHQARHRARSEEHTTELQSLTRTSYAL